MSNNRALVSVVSSDEMKLFELDFQDANQESPADYMLSATEDADRVFLTAYEGPLVPVDENGPLMVEFFDFCRTAPRSTIEGLGQKLAQLLAQSANSCSIEDGSTPAPTPEFVDE